MRTHSSSATLFLGGRGNVLPFHSRDLVMVDLSTGTSSMGNGSSVRLQGPTPGRPAWEVLMIYLDNQATTPLDPRVLDAMLPYLTTRFGNPSSPHRYGREARDAVEESRKQLCRLLGARSTREVVFTSGATESNNLAIKGVVGALGHRGNHVITTAIEHKSVLATCSQLEDAGTAVTYLPVAGDGRVDPQRLKEAITPRTILVSVMHANNSRVHCSLLRRSARSLGPKGCCFTRMLLRAPAPYPSTSICSASTLRPCQDTNSMDPRVS